MKIRKILLTACLTIGLATFLVSNSSLAAGISSGKDMKIYGKGYGPGNGTGNGGSGPKDGSGYGRKSGTCTKAVE